MKTGLQPPEEPAAEPGGEGFVVETKVGATVCPKMGEPSWKDKFVFVFLYMHVSWFHRVLHAGLSLTKAFEG